MSLVLVVGRPRPEGEGEAGGLARLWATVAAQAGTRDPSETEAPDFGAGPVDATGAPHQAAVTGSELARMLAESEPAGVVLAYAPAEPNAVEAAVESAIATGAGQLFILALAVVEDEPAPSSPWSALRARVDEIGARHPDADIVYVGPPFQDPFSVETILGLVRGAAAEPPELLAGIVERGFGGDWDQLARFMARLQADLPPGTRVCLRGSAVEGRSYATGEPFDARGPGTSDLDIVLLGDEAMAEWDPEAFFIPGVNSQPLSDEQPEIAPRLEAARRDAQEICGRPVAIQAMAQWFLDLRSALQGTSYAFLDR